MAVEEQKVTPAAQKRADELGIDLSTVEGTGSDGSIKVEDVDNAHADIEKTRQAAEDAAKEAAEAESRLAAQAPERLFRAKINPALGENVPSVDAFGRVFRGGEPVPESEYAELTKAKSPEGIQLILKGKEVK